MLKGLRTSTKLFVGLGSAIFVMLLLGFLSRQALVDAQANIVSIGENRLPSLYGLEEMVKGQLHVANGQRGLINNRLSPRVRQASFDEIAEGLKQVAEGRSIYEALPMDAEEGRIWKDLVPRWEEWERVVRASVDLEHEKDELIASGLAADDSRVVQADERGLKTIVHSYDLRVAASKTLNHLAAMNHEAAKASVAQAKANEARNISTIVLVILLGGIIAVGVGVWTARTISGSLRKLFGEVKGLAEAAVAGQLAARADTHAVPPEFRPALQGMNDTLDALIAPLNLAASYVDDISKGEVPEKIEAMYSGDFNTIKSNLNQLIVTLNQFTHDMTTMSEQHDAGDIDVRMPEEKFQGVYRSMAKGVNDMVFGHIGVNQKAMACVADFAAGNFDAPLERFPGKKVFINENIELLRRNSKALITDANLLSRAAVEGNLSVRADVTKHSGDYRKIVQGVNDTLDALIDPLNVAADYLDKVSRGENPPAISADYRGEFNTIKNNMNQLLATLTRFINEMTKMSAEHDAGDIDVKLDEQSFEGSYRVMARGVNDMVRGHIEVNRKAMACIADFGAGNFDAALERFPGKKAFINDNVELLRKNSKALIADADVLAQASIEGHLSTRADPSKHQGDFRKIVDGFNRTLDAVIQPVMEAIAALESLARYDMRVRMQGDYRGDHARIKDALNGTAQALGEALAQVADASQQVAGASQQIAASSQAVSQGASEQASSLEETSSSLEEMSSMTKQNADNTVQARSLAQTTKEAAAKGGHAMHRMTDAMEKIRAASEGTAEIIKDINEIAFQTNLLALNAAVEAARAGDAGRGFAVVAEEVRNLALRSKEAAKKTEDLIRVAVGHSENGRVITDEVASSLGEIEVAAGKVNDIVSEIAVASQEQSRGIEQVNTAVAEMDKVVQAAAANAEESSSAADELANQSVELASLIQRFKLDRDQGEATRQNPQPNRQQPPRRGASATVPPRRPANGARLRKLNGSNGAGHKLTPEDIIPLESDPEFQDF